MQKHIIIALATILLASVQIGIAADTQRAADHEALRELRAEVVEALNSQDVQALAPHLADEFVYTGIDQTVISDLEGLKAYFVKVFESPDSSVKSVTIEAKPEILTRFIAENVGICYGTAKETYTLDNGKEAVLNSRWTATCVKENGAWKVSAIQSGVNVLENTVLGNTKTFWRNCAVGSGIAGLLLGVLGSSAFFGSRRKKD